MEKRNHQEIIIKKFTGRISINGDLFEVLKNENLVFLYYKKNEVYIMKNEAYRELLQNIKMKSGRLLAWFDRNKDGRETMRKLCACACSIAINKSYMALEGGERVKKKLLGQELRVKIFS